MTKTAAATLLVLIAAPVQAIEEIPSAEQSPLPAAAEASVIQEFEIDRSDRMTVPVRINNSEPFEFVVDTGSERTVIADDLGRRLALEAGPQLNLATITGPTKVGSFYIEQLAMNSIMVESIEAPALERRHLGAYGLLGIDSLEDNKVHLDFRKQQMEVLPSPRSGRAGKLERGMIVVSAKRKAGRMILSSAEIDGFKVDIILDTGAQGSMGNFALREKLRKRHLRAAYVPVMMRSVTGEQLPGDFGQIRSIRIGSFSMNDMPVIFSENYAFKALKLNDRPAILFGMDALKMFDRVIIDFANRRVAFDLPRGARIAPVGRLALADR
jgi:predicted aspartyl protease